ncbi:MAG TPA: hypothetical protein VKX31_00055 [Brumimicrobium sp.]|nr:hypothetical protein [Brumimicrobium sp.]
MRIQFLFFLLFLLPYFVFSQENPTLVDIPHEVFIGNSFTDFDKILVQDESIAEKVKILHAYDELDHELTVRTNSFEEYWNAYRKFWYLIQFKKGNAPLLLFKGHKHSNDEREFVEIFDLEKQRGNRLQFSEVGKLLAYKINPYTKELVLFTHKYPCCRSASHNLYTIRQINHKIVHTDRFFVGRDRGDMVGPFFPEVANHTKEYKRLDKKTELRWSPAVVEEDAFLGWTPSNLIIHYNKGAVYKVLGEQEGWQFVLFSNGIAEEQSMMLNYTNFLNKGVYGWIKK